MNCIKEIVNKYLGVDINEEFNVKGSNEKYRITEEGTIEWFSRFDDTWTHSLEYQLAVFFINIDLIVKKPFKPKQGDTYWFYSIRYEKAVYVMWDGGTNDHEHWSLGNCFKTKKEAELKGKELIKKIMEEYENS